MHSNRERKIDSVDRFAACAFGGAKPANVVNAGGGIESSAVAPDQSRGKQCLRCNAVVVAALPLALRAGCSDAGAMYDTAGCVTSAGQRRTLKHQTVRQKRLRGCANRPACTRYSEDRRRHVVVESVDTPNAPIAGPDVVAFAKEQPAAEQRLHPVGAVQCELKIEVIKWTVIGILGLAREPVADRKARAACTASVGLRG